MPALPPPDGLEGMKRAQLVKLCKRYGLKAQGKNTELIIKLRAHAGPALPMLSSDADTDMDLDTRSHTTAQDTADEDRDMHDVDQTLRAQAEWEMVDGTSPSMPRAHTIDGLSGLMRGTAPPPMPKSVSLGKNLKAFASAIKRVGSSRSNLVAVEDFRRPSIPPHVHPASTYELPAQLHGGSTKSDTASLMQVDDLRPLTPHPPSPSAQQGKQEPEHSPAPTTIRLVKSSSGPVRESPELPEGRKSIMFSEFFPPLSGALELAGRDSLGLYPKLPDPAPAPSPVEQDHLATLPGAFPMAAPSTPPSLPQPAPATPFQFVFGSPQRGVTKAEFSKVTQNVLEELNRRVVAAGGKAGGVPVLSFGAAGAEGEEGDAKGWMGRSRARFEEKHDKHFAKMDSIADHYAARRGNSGEPGPSFPSRANKRKSTDAHAPARAGPSAAAAATTTAEETDEGDRRATKRLRASSAHTRKIQPAQISKGEVVQVRDTPAQRKKLDTAARSRRSSLTRRVSPQASRAMGSRLTVANNGSGSAKQAGMGKIGFFGRTANAVRHVFNAGTTATKPMPVPQRMLNQMPPPQLPAAKAKETEKKPLISNPSAMHPRAPTQKAAAYGGLAAAPHKPSNARTASGSRAASDSTARTPSGTHRIPSMPQRRPLPSFSSAMQGAEKENKPPHAWNLHASQASSKGLGGSVMSEKELNGSLQVPQRTITKKPSTLYAPTISSLARMQPTIKSPQPNIATTPLPAIQEPTSILKSTTANPLDTPLNIRPKWVAPATAPLPRFNSGLTFSPMKPMANISPSKGMMSPSKSATSFAARRRPRISRGRVISKLNERRNAAGGSNIPVSLGKSRSSMALKAHSRRSLGVKAAAGLSTPGAAMDRQRRVRQSEIARRKSLRVRASGGLKSPMKSPQKRTALAI